MDCKPAVIVAIFFMVAFTSCNWIKKQDVSCLQLDDTKVVGDIQFQLATTVYQEERTENQSHIFFKVYIRMSNVKKNRSFLFASKDEGEYHKKYTHLSFNANKDFLLRMGTEDIEPIGYTFVPSNEVSRYDELIYTFRLDKKKMQEKGCARSDIQYWYIDRIAGTGNICFRAR